MRLAITGATGFLGRRLLPAARAAGHEVRVLLHPSEPPERRKAFREGEAVVGELGEAGACAALVRECDVVIHLAALGVQSRDRDWDRVIHVNVVAPVQLVRAAHAAGVRRLVTVGTALEYAGYGSLPDAPWTKSAMPLCDESALVEPANAYGATKAAGGLLVRTLCRELGLPAWYLRLASMYGPEDDSQKLLPAALLAAGRGQPFEMSPGEQVRDWLHVDDAVSAIVSAASRNPTQDEAILNLGTGKGIALEAFVREAYRAVGADPGLVRAGARAYRGREPHFLVLDPRKAQAALAWRARESLDLLFMRSGAKA